MWYSSYSTSRWADDSGAPSIVLSAWITAALSLVTQLQLCIVYDNMLVRLQLVGIILLNSDNLDYFLLPINPVNKERL